MSVLSDRTIRERISKGDLIIEPLEDPDHAIGPASVDFRLGNKFTVFKIANNIIIDPKNYDDKLKQTLTLENNRTLSRHEYTDVYEGGDKPFVIHPGDFILGKVHERIKLPPDIGAMVNGRSSLGRIGLIIHSTAGWADPGFDGHITLEITNIGKLPIKLYPGMRVGQFILYSMSTPADIPYDKRKQSKYNKEKGATQSKIHLDKEMS